MSERMERLRGQVLPLKERRRIQEDWLRRRLETVLPEAMKQTGIDMWIVMTDEQNEDPVTKTLLPPKYINAHGKMILLFALRPDGTVLCESVSRPSGVEDFYRNSWYGITDTDWKGKQIAAPSKSQLEYLRQLVEEFDPKTIGVNMDAEFPYCDGLTASNYQALTAALGDYAGRIVPATALGIAWMERRCPGEIERYDAIVRLAHDIIAEIFSSDYVVPGVTTVDDLALAFSQIMVDLGLMESFESSCAVFRHGDPGMHNEGYTIQPGDILHCDIGIDYMGLCTDTQQLAYILKPGETEPPAGLRHAMAVGNRLQDIVCSHFAAGKSGNEVLAQARAQAEAEGIDPRVYSHPLGVFAHGPGPTIGYFGNQGPSEHGKLLIHPDTAYALELNVTVPIPEWDGQKLMTCLETDIFFDGVKARYLDQRQTQLIVLR